MNILATILVSIVALMHIYILWLEMFAWETRGRKVFRGIPKELFKPTKTFAANQGLYNGFLAAGLIWSLVISDPDWQVNVALFFLGCVAAAGIFGAFTADRKIFYFQSVPALLGIAALLMNW